VSYLDRLENIYRRDRNTLFTELGHCLAATSANVTSVCAPIIDNQATNAFEYYRTDGPRDNFFAQQNTLALQYTAGETIVVPDFGRLVVDLPQDVIYIDELPPFPAAGGPSSIPIAGEAAFVSFVDRPFACPPGCGGIVPPGELVGADWVLRPPLLLPILHRAPGALFVEPFVNILALAPNEPLSTNNVSTKVRDNPPALSPFTFWQIGRGFGLDRGDLRIEGFPGAVFTSVSCTPTFADPCAIDYRVPEKGRTPLAPIQNIQIEGLFD
jgi:hypothetical protein